MVKENVCEVRKELQSCSIKELQKMKFNKELEASDIMFVNNSILAKLRSSREIPEFYAEFNYYKNIKDDDGYYKVLKVFKQVAPFIKSILSKNQIALLLSDIKDDIIVSEMTHILEVVPIIEYQNFN